MKAVVITEYGGPEVLRLQDRPTPEPGAGEVCLRVAMTSVNMVETSIRAGKTGAPLPFVPGLDATGRVVAVGAGVTRFRPGDRVVAFTEGGSYAEFARAREALTYAVPETADDVAVCGIVTMVAAWNVLHLAGRMAAGDRVLVRAAAGSVGALAVQLARLGGARLVVGMVGAPAKTAAVLDNGAHHAMTYGQLDEAVALSDGGYDVILDANGGPDFVTNQQLLAPGGRLVTFGEAAGSPGSFATTPLLARNASVIGYSSAQYRATNPEFLRPAAETMIRLAAERKIRVPVAARLALADAPEAHLLMESRRAEGKVLLQP